MGDGAAALAPPWRPELLRAVAARLRAQHEPRQAARAEALAGKLEEWPEGKWEDGAAWAATVGVVPADVDPLLPLACALVSLSEARRLLRTCGNPGCTNLAGDSEEELPLKACLTGARA